MYKKILLPIDGSKHALKAAEHAFWLADNSHGEIIALHVVETSSFSDIRARDLKKEMKEMLKDEGDQTLEELMEFSQKKNFQGNITAKVEEGSPAEKILHLAEDDSVDLVVMGTSGKHGIDRFLIGSVAEKVVRNSTSPVLVVH